MGVTLCLILKAALFLFLRGPSDAIIVQEIGPHKSGNTNHVELFALRVSQIPICLEYCDFYFFFNFSKPSLFFPCLKGFKMSFKCLVITFS